LRWARVENGIVREIIDLEPQGRYTPEIVAQFAVCDDTVVENDIHEDGHFKKPIIVIDEVAEIEKQLEENKIDLDDILELIVPLLKNIPQEFQDKINSRKTLKAQLKILKNR